MILKVLHSHAGGMPVQRQMMMMRVMRRRQCFSSPSFQNGRYFSGSAGASTVAGLEVPFELSGDSAPRYPNLLALPVVSQPIFPMRPKVIILRDQATIAAVEKVGYVGVFLRKRYPKGVTEGGVILDKPEIITERSDLYTVGTFCKLQKINASPDNHDTRDEPTFVDDSEAETTSTTPHAYWLMGKRRINLTSIDSVGPPIDVTVSHWDRLEYISNDTIKALSNELLTMTRELSKESALFRESMSWYPSRIDASDPYRLADFCASIVTHASPEDLQAVLEEEDAEMRLHRALLLLIKDKEVAKVQQEIAAKIGQANSESHRKHFLRQQLDVIKGMLGIDQKDKEAFLNSLRKQLSEWPAVPAEVQQVIDKEMERFDSMEASSSEYTVSRTYLDWLCSLPWGKMSPDNFDLHAARKILDRDHYGMDDVKDTIMEFIAVGKLKGSVQGKIICLAGPPGVGKTSVAKSIASALGREFFRFSVGGLTDTSEVRGHRRTYVGALPGKLIQGLKLAGSMNPLVLIDEIDKIGQGVRGNPGHALLEVLDPNQNSSFVDQYLDVPVDMSNVLFVCTANTLETIPGPLLDRMEIFQLSGYDSPEKVAIAEQYLIPKSMTESGLITKNEEVPPAEGDAPKDNVDDESTSPPPLYTRAEIVPESLAIDKSAIETLVRWYAREAGVRNLANYIDKITRKLALQLVAEEEGTKLNDKSSRKSDSWNVTEDNLAEYVGKPIFTSDRMYEKDPLPNGIVMGLAYTPMGGSALYIETQAIRRGLDDDNKRRGGGTLKVTGHLGDVMKESSTIAYTVARARLAQLDPTNKFFDENDIHLHVPEGATRKDGPSAGAAMVTSMLSLALDVPVRADLAMTGEISLTGKVLPIGGVKEKTMAARRAGITCMLLPTANQRDWDELASYLKEGVDVHFADDYDSVRQVAFTRDPVT